MTPFFQRKAWVPVEPDEGSGMVVCDHPTICPRSRIEGAPLEFPPSLIELISLRSSVEQQDHLAFTGLAVDCSQR
jgi:hypothetical protein